MTRFGDASVVRRLATAVRAMVARPEPAPGPARRPLVVGHRGTPREEPENTLPSFARAVEMGADAVETDVCVTADGHVVLWHDHDPDGLLGIGRQAGREGFAYVPDAPRTGHERRRPVSQLDRATLYQHYGYRRRGSFVADVLDGDTVPQVPFAVLEDLAAWAAHETRLAACLLDVKLPAEEAGLAPALVDCLVRFTDVAPSTEVRLLCPQREVLDALVRAIAASPLAGRRVRPTADFEIPGVLRELEALPVRDVSLGCDERTWIDFTAEVAACVEARDRGAIDSVVVWTINDPDRLRELVSLRVDGILTDDVATLCGLLTG